MAAYPQSTGSKNIKGSSNYNEENEFILWGMILAGLFVLIMVLKIIAAATVYVYAPFTFFPWVMATALGKFGYILSLLIYAFICITIELYIYSKDKKARKKDPRVKFYRSHGFAVLAAYLFGLAVFALLKSDPKTHGLLLHVSVICNPSNEWLPFLSCQNSLTSFVSVSYFQLINILIVPSSVLAALCLPALLRGIVQNNEHPESMMSLPLTDTDKVIGTVVESFSHCRFFNIINPCLYPLDSGVFEKLKSSRNFMVDERIIEGFTQKPQTLSDIKNVAIKPKVSRIEDEIAEGTSLDLIPLLDENRFNDVMRKQLGVPYSGIDSFSPLQIIIMATCIGQACASEPGFAESEADLTKKLMEKRIDQIWSWLTKDVLNSDMIKIKKSQKNAFENNVNCVQGYRLDMIKHIDLKETKIYEDALKYVKKYIENPVMQEIISSHGYASTIMYATILKARTVGVFQPSTLRWVILFDRTVWATIVNAGRPSVFAEGMAVTSHYNAEIREGRKLSTPDFIAAYSGFRERLEQFEYTTKMRDRFETAKFDPELGLNFRIVEREANNLEDIL